MKRMSTLITCCLMAFAITTLSAQEPVRYLDPIFDEVKITDSVQYGINASILTLSLFQEAIPVPLELDIYEPVGDDVRFRPLVLIFSTGNFLPQTLNGNVFGTRTDSSSVETATRLAKMGYVAACVSYRTGWNPLLPTQPERAFQLIQAAYRGVQDARTAVRFFKDDVSKTNQYGVDTTKITVWGYGTGGYVSVNTAYLNEYNEIITTTNPAGKFLLPNADGVPTTPMIIEAINGDLEGKTVGVAPPGIEPIPAGDTLNYPNHVEHSSDIQLCVNAAGALGDISWLDQGEIPLIAFQNPKDANAPYDSRVLIVPTTGDGIVEAQGCLATTRKAVELGNQQALIDEAYDDEWTQAAKAASEKAGHEYVEGLYPFNLPPDVLGNENGDPWQWWDSTFWSQVPVPDMPDLNWHQVARSQNAYSEANLAKTYIDTIFGYFLPRAYTVLSLGEEINNNPTSTKDLLSKSQVGLITSPIPAQDVVNFQTAVEYPIQGIEVMDLNGRLVKNHYHMNEITYQLSRDGLPSGIYLARLRFKEGVVVQKIMFD